MEVYLCVYNMYILGCVGIFDEFEYFGSRGYLCGFFWFLNIECVFFFGIYIGF